MAEATCLRAKDSPLYVRYKVMFLFQTHQLEVKNNNKNYNKFPKALSSELIINDLK